MSVVGISYQPASDPLLQRQELLNKVPECLPVMSVAFCLKVKSQLHGVGPRRQEVRAAES